MLTVTRDKGIECNNAIVIRLLHASHESRVQVGRVISVAVTAGSHARVYTCAVAAPDLEVSLRYWFAGIDIDDLNVKGHWNTFLALGDVFTDKLARDPVRSLGSLRRENAGVVASKENRWINIRGNAGEVALVAGVEDTFGITSAEKRLV
jgi:hypothetical protein